MKRLLFLAAFMVMTVFSFAAITQDAAPESVENPSLMTEVHPDYSPLYVLHATMGDEDEGKSCTITIETRRADGTWDARRVTIDGVTCMELINSVVKAVL